MKPHKHAAVIKAWADGAVIQASGNNVYWRPAHNPDWNEHTYFRASIAEVEGKPVFEGDVLYADGRKLPIIRVDAGDIFVFDCGGGYCCYPHKNHVSWNPPAPKTVTVTIPRPTEISYSGGCVFIYYRTEEMGIDALNAYHFINEAMK
ncbi:MAG: hypothetical protein WAW75_04930 [Gallionella sp.]